MQNVCNSWILSQKTEKICLVFLPQGCTSTPCPPSAYSYQYKLHVCVLSVSFLQILTAVQYTPTEQYDVKLFKTTVHANKYIYGPAA